MGVHRSGGRYHEAFTLVSKMFKMEEDVVAYASVFKLSPARKN